MIFGGTNDRPTSVPIPPPLAHEVPTVHNRRIHTGREPAMTQTNGPKKLPAEAVDLYSQFIHGEIDRRAFMDGVKRFAIGGLTTAAIVEALMPKYAQAQQIRKDDERIKASYETVPSPDG